jgi:8-oxo-dGTP pyrophosphatase MutT (NUDIX family)
MYEVFFNENRLILTDKVSNPTEPVDLIMPYRGKVKQLLACVDRLEKRDTPHDIWLIHADVNKLWADFCALFTHVDAAGGLVSNTSRQWLFIVRGGYLDLPKGKLDKGESARDAALREVEEETGIGKLAIGDHMATTWHIYRINKKRFLKKTEWFQLTTAQSGLGVPQAEEGITEIRWLPPEHYLMADMPTYRNLRAMIQSLIDARP